MVIASTNHRLIRRKRVTIADLATERWILSTINTLASQKLFRAFADAGISPPRVMMRTPSLPLRDILVSSTDCLGYSSTRVARYATPRIRFAEFRVKELAWIRRVAIAYRKDAYLSPAARRFTEILRVTARNIAAKS